MEALVRASCAYVLCIDYRNLCRARRSVYWCREIVQLRNQPAEARRWWRFQFKKVFFLKSLFIVRRLRFFFRHYLARRRSYTIHASIFNFSFDVFLWSFFLTFFKKKRDNAISLTWIVIWKMCLILDIFLTNDMNRKNWHFPKDWFIISIVNRRFGPRNRISMPIKIIQYCHRIIITIL